MPIDIYMSLFFTVWIAVGFGLPTAMVVFGYLQKKINDNYNKE